MVSDRAQSLDIGQLAVHGVRIEFEIGGMHHGADRRLHHHADRIGDTVADMEKLHREAAERQPVAGRNGMELAVRQQSGLLQFDLGKAARQRSGIDRNVQVTQQVGQGADMILVAVGQHDRLHPIRTRGQIRDVGVDQVDAEHVAFGEHQAGIDHQNVIAAFQGHHVLADFAEAPQGDDAKRCLCQMVPPVYRTD